MQRSLILSLALVLVGAAIPATTLRAQPQLTPAQLAALTPLDPGAVPRHGTFWFLLGPNPGRPYPPLPCPPGDMTNAPIYALDDRHFLVDDSAVDWEARRQQQEIDRALHNLEVQLGLAEPMGTEEGGGPLEPLGYPSNSLWLSISQITNGLAPLTIRGTSEGTLYGIESREALNPTNGWTAEAAFFGAAGQNWTPAGVYLTNRMTTTRFFRAIVYTGDPDEDGLPNWWELQHGLNPNNANSTGAGPDASLDTDGDGYSNVEEYMLGYNPGVADPPRPTVTITASDPSAGEPNSPGAFTINRSGVTTRELTVYFTVAGLARAGFDFESLGDHVTLGVGQSSVAFQVLPVDDNRYEGEEEVTVRLMPGLDYVADTNSVTVIIAENELQPVSVGASWDPVVEGSGTNGMFLFYREGDTRLPLTVNFSLTGTATNGVIYQTLPTWITFAVGSSSTNLTVVLITNNVASGETTCLLSLLPSAAYRIETNGGGAILNFLDDDLPMVNIVAADPDAREAGLNPGRFSVSRTGPTPDPLMVYYRVSGTALMSSQTVTNDYKELSNIISISAGQTNAFIDIIPDQDTNSEPMETVVLILAGHESYAIGNSNSAMVRIDDDEPLSYSTIVKRPSIYQQYGSLSKPGVIEITRKGSALAASYVSCSVTYTNGTPVYQGNYALSGDMMSGQVYFQANQWEATVNLQHQTTDTSPMQLRFAGQIATVPCWGPDHLVYMMVEENDATEGDPGDKARFRVVRGIGTGPPLTVKLRLEGTATYTNDFSTNLQTVVLGQNVNTVWATVEAHSDGVTEGWENIILRFDTSDLSYATYDPNTSDPNRQETYGVLWMREWGTPEPRPAVDTDGDLLNDAFETAWGLNPLVAEDFQADADQDGLSALEEQALGTNPNLADTDIDGVNDFREMARGTNPTNALDVVAANGTVAVRCYVGDNSGSKSETWQLKVGPWSLNNSAPGTVISRTISLEEGTTNTVKLYHLGSTLNPPDLDYYAGLGSGNSAPPAFFVRDPQQLLGQHLDPGDGPAYSNKIATILVPKLELTWTNRGDNLPLDVHTNAINNLLLGKRIFVGAKTPTDSDPRNSVMLQIRSTPPLVGSNVWLRAFDVDDTTAENFDRDGAIDTTGRAGDDNFSDYLNTPKAGLFVASGQATNVVTLNSSGEALVEFRVGMQPGNNYRVAASVFPSNNLSTLQIGSPAGNGFVSADTDTIEGGFNGALSPTLTVWRKLHLEFDSMEAVPTSGPEANLRTGSIATIKANSPVPGQSTIALQQGLPAIQANELENGTLTINSNQFPIIGNYPQTLVIPIPSGSIYIIQDTIIIQGLASAVPVDTACTFTDDDDRFLSTIGLPPALPKDGESTNTVAGIRSVFLPACIYVVDANTEGFNPAKRVPFGLNTTMGIWGAGVFDDVKDLHDSNLFWAHTVTFGYQAAASEDMDPNSEDPLAGITLKKSILFEGGVTGIFVETIRDGATDRFASSQIGNPANYPTLRTDYWNYIFGTVAHEAGHAPGGHSEGSDHAEDALMQKGVNSIDHAVFMPVTIKRLRNATRWSD